MTRYTNNGFWWSSVTGVMAAIGVVASYPFPTLAQITPDQTLGAEASRITPNVDVRGGMADRIDGGAIRGSNLFHSFRDFNVGELQRVYFANPQGIENILGRVTGSTRSNILGTLGVDGGANLFLINPNGIIFGPNAKLDIRGSFLAGTADGFKFPDGSEFRAKDPNAPPLVTVNIPIGLQYGPDAPAALVSQADLTVGQSMMLSGGSVTSTGKLSAPEGLVAVEGVAGDVQVQNVTAKAAILASSQNLLLAESQLRTTGDLSLLAQGTVWVRDSVANPFVAHAGGNLYIRGNQGIDILALNHPEEIPFQSGGNLTLVSDGIISGDSHFSSGENYSMLNLAGEPGTFVSYYDPIIYSNGNVTFGDYTGVSLKVEATGGITGGNIKITGPECGGTGATSCAPGIVGIPTTDPDFNTLTTSPAVILRAGVPVNPANVNVSQGPPATTVTAGGTVFTSGLVSYSQANATNPIIAPGGTTLAPADDQVSAPIPLGFTFNYFGVDYNNIYISSNGFITPVPSATSGCCTGGVLPSPSSPSAAIAGWWEDLTSIPGGAISYQTVGAPGNQIFVVNYNNIQHYPTGNPASFQIQLFEGTNNIELHYPNAATDGGVHSAGIQNQSGTVGLQFFRGTTALPNNTAVLYTPIQSTGTPSIAVRNIDTSSTSGVGGTVELQAAQDITITGNINSSSSLGRGGAVTITSQRGGINLSLNGGFIDSSSRFGNGGSITLTANNGSVIVNNSRIRSNTKGFGNSTAGAIDITGNSLFLTNSSLDAGALKDGNGGNVVLNALNNGSILLDGSTIFSDTPSGQPQNQGGQINLIGGSVSLKNGSLVDASTSGQGQGGSVSVLATGSIALDDSSISTTVKVGAGGNGGLIDIQGGAVALTNGGRIEARTLGTQGTSGNAQAGDIQVKVTSPDFVDPVSGQLIPTFIASGFNSQGFSSGLYTASEQATSGQGGNITVTVPKPNGTVRVSDGAVFSARNQGNFLGGSIKVDAQNVELLNGGQFIATTSGSGSAANIEVLAPGHVTISGADANFVNRPPITSATGSATDMPIQEQEANNSPLPGPGGPQQITQFSIANNPNIDSSITIPHASIQGTGDGTFDYYQFHANKGDTGIFDIDSTTDPSFPPFNPPALNPLDTQLFLFRLAPDGKSTTLLQENDDASISLGAGGSTSGLESFIRTRTPFSQSGDYIIGVSHYPSSASDAGIDSTSSPLPNNSTYTLQVSVGPDITTNAGLAPNQGANSGIYAPSQGTGAGGSVKITTSQLNIQDRAEISASTVGLGQGGSVTVDAMNGGSVSLDNGSINTAVQAGAAGSTPNGIGGDINISGASAVSLTNRSSLDASTSGQGHGGDISVNVLDGGTVSLVNSSINARTIAQGEGGTVSVLANGGSLSLAGSSNISTAVSETATGNGNAINISTGAISLTQGSRLEASTLGSGNAGNININVSDRLDISGASPLGAYSGLLTSSERANSGRGGNITINTANNPQGILRVTDGGFLSARTTGSSPGGNIEVNVRELQAVNGGQIITSGSNSGKAGDIRVTATDGITISGSNPNFSPSANTTTSGGTGLLTEAEPNDSIAGAQFIDSSLFSIASNPNINSSTTIPHVSISGSGNGTFDYYSFNVTTPNSPAIFDIDNGFKPGDPS
ncbi:MAG TPA: filamentous hemagglutinin N-terminal domain-containing protein, partial [Allocoleopsis sp.]